MKISKTHEKFSTFLRHNHGITKQDVLDYPEKYLGPNWEAVINFWLYFDTLTEEQLEVVEERYWDLSVEEQHIASQKAWNVAIDTTENGALAGNAAYFSVPIARYVAKWSTVELIGLDKLLAQGHQPLFFPLFLNL
jgi:hypothetical protein